MAQPGPIKPGDLVDGKYRIDRVLGKGGMGMVLAATDLTLQRTVAIKVLLADLADDEDFVLRFLREARAAVRLSSEHAVRVHEVGELEDKTPYMVMEYLVGRDLGAVLDEVGRLPPSDAVDYVLQATEAIADAHSAGIIHRDIKPANLFLTRRADKTPLIKVLDFGLAKAPSAMGESGLTQSSAVFGSPQYMSPEQLKGAAHVDSRTDIWALGASLYHLLAGVLPFEAGSVAELAAMIMRDPLPPPHERCPDIPVDLSTVIMRCLEKDPSRRWANVADLARALEPYGSPQMRGVGERVARVLHVAPATVPILPKQNHPPADPHAITATEAVFDSKPSHARWRTLWAVAAGLALAASILTTMLLVRGKQAEPMQGPMTALPPPSVEPAGTPTGTVIAEPASRSSAPPIAPSASVSAPIAAPIGRPPSKAQPARPRTPTRPPIPAPATPAEPRTAATAAPSVQPSPAHEF